ncbi:MAG: outer membrane protein assembly factor BamA [Rhodobacteraceae bacterium]|nr:outer membrane protein assembly factor BamA [Paracoccaceae bacterium]
MALGKFAGTSCVSRAGGHKELINLLAAFGLALALLLVFLPGRAIAQDYRFNSVVVEGNQRIQTGTIVNYTGIARGQTISGGALNDAYQRVLDSGLFESVDFEPRGNRLVIRVTEFPTINRISFEGNRRIGDEDLAGFIESTPRQVFSPSKAERDANTIAEAYSQQGRIASAVTPRIIRRSENRVDLIFEISEGDTVEVERVSFVGNRVFSDRRLRRVLDTKQATILRALVRNDTLVADRIEFDKQVLRDFYLSRGYVDFRTNSVNAELSRERDGFFVVFNVQEGQQFRFGQITTVSEVAEADADAFQSILKIRPGVVYSPSLVENSIARMERLAIRNSIDFLRVEPRITRNDRDLTLDVEFVLTRGPRIFVERIDIEGNTTTLDRVVRRQFRIVEGDPFNPREVRESAERIRALGFFGDASVEAREGSSANQVIVDVDVEEKPTGTLSLGGSYSVNDGFGVALGLRESNWLGRGQRLRLDYSGAEDAEQYGIGFSEPALLGRDVRFDFDIGYSEADSSFASYDTERLYFSTGLTFPVAENSKLQVRYSGERSEMLARDTPVHGTVIGSEIAQGARTSSSIGYTYTFDSRLSGLNPTAGVLVEVGQDFAGIGGDNEFIRTRAKVIGQRMVLNEEVTLRATFEAGALNWRNGFSRATDRFVLGPDIMRGFEPSGIGPRDTSGGNNDALGGNLYAVVSLEAEFPLGLPEELGLRGAVFYDVGSLWNLDNVNTTGGTIIGNDNSARHVIGVSLLWDSVLGPLRFNFSNAVRKEAFDQEQSFDFTISTTF